MDFLHSLFDTVIRLVTHLEPTLVELFKNYGNWFYPIMMLIVFCETGLVVTPFLPGDSLLFMVGALGSRPDISLNVPLAMALLFIAPLMGDNVNYWLGRLIGHKVAKSRFVKKEYLARTHNFYEKYGPKTVILARFVPIVRTFAPFVAGLGRMNYLRFLTYSVVGAALWVGILVPAGYYFGKVDFVKKHIEMVVLAIIVISVLPAVIEGFRAWRAAKAGKGHADA
jgi:membrane-associated protein